MFLCSDDNDTKCSKLLRAASVERLVYSMFVNMCRPYVLIAGWCRDFFGNFTISLILMAGIMFVGSILSYAAGMMAERTTVPSNVVSVFTVEGPESKSR